jgi:hypothetical protein
MIPTPKPLPEDYPRHLPAVGLVGWIPEHESGDCAWCDALRWREVADQHIGTGRWKRIPEPGSVASYNEGR